MSLKLISFSSGSRGNCVLVASGGTAILIDAGVPVSSVARYIRALGYVNPKILITHCHHDHVGHLASFCKKYKSEAYCHIDCYFGISNKTGGGKLVAFENDFFIGDITVSPIAVCHDVPCCGFSFYNAGRKISYLTDLGHVTPQIIESVYGSNLIFIESNHDEKLLLSNKSYPKALKNRILSKKGHLSNTACGEALREIIKGGTTQIILGHLSEENNYPELAYSTISGILNGLGHNVHIEVVGFNKPSPIFEVE